MIKIFKMQNGRNESIRAVKNDRIASPPQNAGVDDEEPAKANMASLQISEVCLLSGRNGALVSIGAGCRGASLFGRGAQKRQYLHHSGSITNRKKAVAAL